MERIVAVSVLNHVAHSSLVKPSPCNITNLRPEFRSRSLLCLNGMEYPKDLAMYAEQPDDGFREKWREGTVSILTEGKPELLIVNIEMRNPTEEELTTNKELKRQERVFDVKVVNKGKTPVSNVRVFLAIMDEGLEKI